METYEVTCTCGDVMTVDASSEAEAIAKMKEKMGDKEIKEHWRKMHKGEPVPDVEEVHQMIETDLVITPSIA